MEEIVNQVNRVTRLITEISNATKEQSSGISQVGEAVNQLDQVTQQNAALVEESAAAADSLKQQAAMLAELVDVFKLANTDAGHSLAGIPAPAPATSAAVKATPAPTTMTHERPLRTSDRNSSRGALKEPASARAASSDWNAF
jgi:methyl-accepting chemotaxis protein